MTTEDVCSDCGRPLRPTGSDNCRREHPTAELFGFDVECKDNTIARLRSELASAREPTECPEYTGDEATVRCHLGSLLYAHEALDRLLASARELGAALASILDHSPHVGITQPGGHVTCWTAQMDSGRERVYADGATMVDALLALRAKQGGE